MEYFIENQLSFIDLDNLLNAQPILENGEGDTFIKKASNKIKEIWEKIKKFFTEKKVEKDAENINRNINNIKRIEKENPEVLANEKDAINKKTLFEGISIKDWASAFKQFFDYNLDCIRRRDYYSMKKLSSFLNRKQKIARTSAFLISTAMGIIINTYYMLKGISLNTKFRESLSNLEKRAAVISVKRARNSGVNDATKELIQDAKSYSGKSNKNAKSKIRDIKQASKDFKKAEDTLIDNTLNEELKGTNLALDILKSGLLKFNKFASLVSAIILQCGIIISRVDKASLSETQLKIYNKFEKTKLYDKLSSEDLRNLAKDEIKHAVYPNKNRYKSEEFGKQVTKTMNSHYNDANSKFKDHYNGYENPSGRKSISYNDILSN